MAFVIRANSIGNKRGRTLAGRPSSHWIVSAVSVSGA